MKKINPYPLAGHLLEANLRTVEREDWIKWAQKPITEEKLPKTMPPTSRLSLTNLEVLRGSIYHEARRWIA